MRWYAFTPEHPDKYQFSFIFPQLEDVFIVFKLPILLELEIFGREGRDPLTGQITGIPGLWPPPAEEPCFSTISKRYR